MVFTQLRAVDINICIRIYTVKIDDKCFSHIAFRQDKCLAIPACTAGQEATFSLSTRGIALTDAEIMRQSHRLPTGIVKAWILCGTGSSEIEFPVFIEIDFSAVLKIRGNLHRFLCPGNRLSCICCSGIGINCICREGEAAQSQNARKDRRQHLFSKVVGHIYFSFLFHCSKSQARKSTFISRFFCSLNSAGIFSAYSR